jgi:hypothetical protein
VRHETTAAIDLLAHHSHTELPKHLTGKEATHAFADKIREWDTREQILLGRKKILIDPQSGPRAGGSWHSPPNGMKRLPAA